ncbi:aspartyl/asparaginyl beta-hydroxylase domain-containing protein [Variovorax robiniae]|uniref:Aspartyl/asparaginyl beta-hydroxylase domain-containing protein n=1 Tax=Variovorax robiniae TaxID=1836199 RepID=A0ABU8X7K1_9BURK
MKNFQKIAEGCNVLPLMCAVQQRPELWNQNTLRTTHPGTPHTEVSDIWLRFNDMQKAAATGDAAYVMDEHESIDYPAFGQLPQARPLILGLMATVSGERLGRCLITKLAPGGKIAPHVDGGSHAAYYERFHIVLHGKTGSLFRAGDEVVEMKTGDIWWFDNSQEHEVANGSDDDRVHLIVDVRCPKIPMESRASTPGVISPDGYGWVDAGGSNG